MSNRPRSVPSDARYSWIIEFMHHFIVLNLAFALAFCGVPFLFADTGEPSYLGNMSQEDRDLQDLPEPGRNIGVQFGSIDDLDKPASKRTASQTRTSEVYTEVHPSGVTEQQLRDYYNAHKEKFRMPVQLHLKFIDSPQIPSRTIRVPC